jgi:2-oxoglutarate ferredoxin oxidoreductase subunit alpha
LSHGDGPKVVLAPISIHDCFDIMFKAFDIADKYQVPVIVLTEQALGHRRTDLSKGILKGIPSYSLQRPAQTFDPEAYARYRLTENGISPRSVPGDRGGAHVVTGLEHAENGAPRHDPENRKIQMDKRARKMPGIAQEYGDAWRFGPDKAEIGIIGWGATAGAVREAVDRANAEGISVAALYPKILYPNPDHVLRPFIERSRVLLVVEENQSGQYANYLQSIYGAECGFRPERLNKYDGTPFQPGEVLSRIREVAGMHSRAAAVPASAPSGAVSGKEVRQ